MSMKTQKNENNLDFDNLPRLAPKEALILQLLINKGEMYGLGLVNASENRIKRGTVYVTLARMEDKGYVTSRQEEQQPGAIGLPRRLYQITGEGVRVYRAWTKLAASLRSLVPAMAT